MLDLLRDRWFRRLWITTWLCYIGRWIDVTILPWFVLVRTGSPSLVALVGVSRAAPMLLAGWAAGELVDRYPKRQIFVAAQAANAVAASLLFATMVMDCAQPWHAIVYMFFTGLSGAIDFPGRRAYQSDHLKDSQLGTAMALNSVAVSGSSLLGPLVGGALVSLVGYGGVYSAVAAVHIIGVLILLRLPARRCDTKCRIGARDQVSGVGAVREMLKSRAVVGVLTGTVLMNLFGFSYRQALPLIAHGKLNLGPTLYGTLSAAPGLGTVTGAVLLSRRSVDRPQHIFFIGSIVTLVGVLCFALSPVYAVSLILLFTTGLGASGFAAMQSSVVLMATPAELRGRAMGILAVAIGAFPIGSWLVGQMAERMKPDRVLIWMSGLGLLTVGLLWLLFQQDEPEKVGSRC